MKTENVPSRLVLSQTAAGTRHSRCSASRRSRAPPAHLAPSHRHSRTTRRRPAPLAAVAARRRGLGRGVAAGEAGRAPTGRRRHAAPWRQPRPVRRAKPSLIEPAGVAQSAHQPAAASSSSFQPIPRHRTADSITPGSFGAPGAPARPRGAASRRKCIYTDVV